MAGVAADQLVERMRAGDRVAAAEFLVRYESRLRRRIRGKLSQPMRRIFDSLEIMSTLGRRLDRFVGSGRLRAVNEDQFWALLQRMATNAVTDKARRFRRLEALEGVDGPAGRAARAAARPIADHDVDLEQALQGVADPEDRRILGLWLEGHTAPDIAERVGLSHDAVRKRWQRIREELRLRFATPDSLAS